MYCIFGLSVIQRCLLFKFESQQRWDLCPGYKSIKTSLNTMLRVTSKVLGSDKTKKKKKQASFSLNTFVFSPKQTTKSCGAEQCESSSNASVAVWF